MLTSVGDGQGVEIELRQGDGQAPRLMARFRRERGG